MNERLAPVVAGRRRVFCSHMAAYSGKFVPNSLDAVAECVSRGAPRIEVDVRFLSDDSMLVLHDAQLDRSTTGTGPVAELDRASASRLRFRVDPAVRLAFFEEVVDLLRPSDAVLQVDLKGMTPLSEERLNILAAAMEPIGERALLGSQAYWNVRRFAGRGCRLAMDPTLEWHAFASRREGDGLLPQRCTRFGTWDDAPLAAFERIGPAEYVRERIADIMGLLPGTAEWMVDVETIEHLAGLGAALGDALGEHGIELAAWTLQDRGADVSGPLVRRLFDLGVTTIITDNPVELAGYVSDPAIMRA